MKKFILLAALFTSIGLFAAKNQETVKHRMEPKETLFKVSLMYNSTVNDIVRANPGINPKTVQAGAVIKVPKDTKIRDAAFVESFLEPKHNDAPIAEAASPAKAERPTAIEASMTGKEVFVPISQLATVIHKENLMVASTIAKEAPAQASNDENPFLTPSEPRTGPIADEQPTKEEKLTEPASASKDEETGDENPFVTPKQKAAKPAADKVTSSNE